VWLRLGASLSRRLGNRGIGCRPRIGDCHFDVLKGLEHTAIAAHVSEVGKDVSAWVRFFKGCHRVDGQLEAVSDGAMPDTSNVPVMQHIAVISEILATADRQ
jgi:hypothetical protein